MSTTKHRTNGSTRRGSTLTSTPGALMKDIPIVGIQSTNEIYKEIHIVYK
jgi:hypothetical protein